MSSRTSRGGIFISYRREEAAAPAGRLYDHLCASFGADRVFMDVDSVAIGADAAEKLTGAVPESNILLVIIGPRWSAITDSKGKRRIDNPDDFVRVEIETALQRDIPVVPVLVDGAVLPHADDLLPSLRPITRRPVLELSHPSFRSDLSRLLATVNELLQGKPGWPAGTGLSEGGQLPGRRSGERSQMPGKAGSAFGVSQPRTLQVVQRVLAMAFSPDSTRLATGHWQRVRIWNLQTGAAVREMRVGSAINTVQAVAFSPDGTRLATGSEDNIARIWDAITGERQLQVIHGRKAKPANFTLGNATVYTIAFSPDGTRLATGSKDNTARIWDATTGEQQLQVTHGGTIWAVAFSPDGTRLATGSADSTARICDSTSWKQQVQVTHGGAVAAVAFSPDGTRLATGSKDNTARIWDVTTGEQQLEVTHGGAVEAVAFSSDGTRLATASWDKTARIWDAANGIQQHQVTYSGWVPTVAFNPDGTWLATSRNKVARIWPIACE